MPYQLQVIQYPQKTTQACLSASKPAHLLEQAVSVQYVVHLVHKLFDNVGAKELPKVVNEKGSPVAAEVLRDLERHQQRSSMFIDVLGLLNTNASMQKAVHFAGSVPKVMEHSFLALELWLLNAVKKDHPEAKKSAYGEHLEQSVSSLLGRSVVEKSWSAGELLDLGQRSLQMQEAQQKDAQRLEHLRRELEQARKEALLADQKLQLLQKNKNTVLGYHRALRQDLQEQKDAALGALEGAHDRLSVQLLEWVQSGFSVQKGAARKEQRMAAQNLLEYISFTQSVQEERFEQEKERVQTQLQEGQKEALRVQERLHSLEVLVKSLEEKTASAQVFLDLAQRDVQHLEPTQEGGLWTAPVHSKKEMLLQFFAPSLVQSEKKQAVQEMGSTEWSALLRQGAATRTLEQRGAAWVQGARVGALVCNVNDLSVQQLKERIQEGLFLTQGKTEGYPVPLLVGWQGALWEVPKESALQWCVQHVGSHGSSSKEAIAALGLKKWEGFGVQKEEDMQRSLDQFVEHFGVGIGQKVLYARAQMPERSIARKMGV